MSSFALRSRRRFLAALGSLSLSGACLGRAAEPESIYARPPRLRKEGRKPLAVLTTVYRPMSHSYHIGGRFIHGYVPNGRFHVPKHYVGSLYVDQVPDSDLSRETSRDFDIRLA